MVWMYAALLAVACVVYMGTMAKKNMWLWVALYWLLLVAKCLMEFIQEAMG